MRCAGLGTASVHLRFAGHVHWAKNAAEFLGQGLTLFGVEVEQGDLDAVGGEAAGGGGAQRGGPGGLHAVHHG